MNHMGKETFERLFAIPIENVGKDFSSIPVLKEHLYNVKGIEPLPHVGILVAKVSSSEIQQIDKHCGSVLNDSEEQIGLPTETDPIYSNLLKFLKLLAERRFAVTVYYKRTEYAGSHVWEIEASIFDYRNGKSTDYAVSEHYDQGSPTFGTYVERMKYSRVSCEVVNGYKGNAKMPPFDIPFVGLIRAFERYDWDSSQANWVKLE